MKIDNRRQLARAMHSLALSTRDLAKALRLGPRGQKTVERWLAGTKPLPGPAAVAVEAMLRERFGVAVDVPEPDPDVFDGEDHTPHRAYQASLLDNADRPEVVRALVERWWESDRRLLQALVSEPNGLTVEQYQRAMQAVGA